MLTDSESELSSSSEQTAGPSTRTQSAKKRKTMYKCKYSLQWTKTWPFIVAQPDDKHSFLCTVCSKRLSCRVISTQAYASFCMSDSDFTQTYFMGRVVMGHD